MLSFKSSDISPESLIQATTLSGGTDQLVSEETFADYDVHDDWACVSRNDWVMTGFTIEQCKFMCDNDLKCISFEVKHGKSKCQLSTSCTSSVGVTSEKWTLYVKQTPPPANAPTTPSYQAWCYWC